MQKGINTVDNVNPALPKKTLNYGNYGIFLVRGNAGFMSSTVRVTLLAVPGCYTEDLKPAQYPLIKEYTLNYRGLNITT